MRTILWNGTAALVIVLASLGTGCSAGSSGGNEAATAVDLRDLGFDYAAAWSSQDPDRLASFYAEDGTLSVNGAESVGRPAIRATAESFMNAFPDMRVTMDSIVAREGGAVFHWHWTGTNSGPGGTGRSVDLHGFEEWTFEADAHGAEGLIATSDGRFDDDAYRLQLGESD